MAVPPSEASKHSEHSLNSLGLAEQPVASTANRVTVWTGAIAGIAALIGGAALTGTSHYAATGKALKDEGLDPSLRRLAVPIAVSLPPSPLCQQVAIISLCLPRRADRLIGLKALPTIQWPELTLANSAL